MLSRRALLLIGSGTLVVVVAAGAVGFFALRAWLGLPLFAQAPQQPIEFPHTVHAGDLGIACEFCHRNVAQGAAATVPSVGQCMFCHRFVEGTTDTAKAEIDKLQAACGTPLPDAAQGLDLCPEGQPIDWVRVHRLPDHVQFVHEVHIRYFSEKEGIAPSQVCSACHGAVETMTRVKQVRALKMGDCVNCHRQNNAPTDCAACHF